MSPEQEGQGHDDVRVVPPGQEDAELVSGLEAAMEELGAQRRAEVDKELRALEKVNAKHAKRMEKAATKARADLEALKGVVAEDDEQAQELGRRLGEVGKKYRARQGAVLEEAGVGPDALSEEIRSSATVPEHAKARGRRGRAGSGGDDLGWTDGVS
jgi:hypothetical protein